MCEGRQEIRREEIIQFSVKDRGFGLIISGVCLGSQPLSYLTFPCGFWQRRGADVRAAGFGFLLLCLLKALLTGLEWTEWTSVDSGKH